ncbi:MAG: hypothetical protein E7675_07405 [Ruminococcaceae bacterium]|nr:hypothetical protein [Oscillospiraceae bacterium]
MKKIVSMVLLICTLIALVSCDTNNITEPTETTKPTATENQTVIAEKVDYTLYKDGNSTLGSSDDTLDDVVEIVHLEDYINIDMYSYNTFKSEEIEKNITFKFCGKEYELEYFQTKTSDFYNCPSEELRRSKLNHVYHSADGNVEFEIEEDTGRVLFFSDRTLREPEKLTMNFEQAISKAEEIIKSIYGEKALEGYELNLKKSNSKEGLYRISFDRTLASSKDVFDWINLGISKSGELVFFNSLNYGVMDNVRDKVTDLSVEEAKKYILSVYPEGTVIKSIYCVGILNSVGKVCIGVNISYPFNGETVHETININLH